MHNHEPADYFCPMCALVRGENNEVNRQDHIVYQDDKVLAYVSPRMWPNNPGNVLVIPKIHTENIYDIPADLLGDVYKIAKKVAIGVRETYGCTGTSTRQHNEPDGDQHVWHLHVHVYPRHANDELYKSDALKEQANDVQRLEYVKKLTDYFAKNSS